MIRALVIALLLVTPALAQQSVTTRDCSPVAVGDDNVQIIKCGYSAEDYENALARREAQIRSDLERAHTAEKQVLQLQLNEIQRQRADLQASYEQTVQELAALRSRISDIGEGVEQPKIDAAKEALASGDRSKADALFAEVEQMEQEGIDRAATAAYLRGDIAVVELRWIDAARHYSRAAQLVPTWEHLREASRMSWQIGRPQDAMTLVRQLRKLADASQDPIKQAYALNSEAVMWGELGRYDTAADIMYKVIEIERASIGDESEEFPSSLINLAGLLHYLKRYDEATKLNREALAAMRKFSGEQDSRYTSALANLGASLEAMGRPVEAMQVQREAAAIDKAALGTRHPQYASRLVVLADTLRSLERFGEAEALYREAMEIERQILGPLHPNYAGSLNNLALLMQELGRFDEAKPLFREALAVARQVLGDAHPHTRIGAKNLAKLLRERFPEDPALAELEAAFGSDIGRP
ncbi:MAG: tetratricopeptide repeat protein [Pseudomonadota bacterium]